MYVHVTLGNPFKTKAKKTVEDRHKVIIGKNTAEY